MSRSAAGRIAVSGLVNLETSVPATVPFSPGATRLTDGIVTHPSGVALNVATALAALGNGVRLTAITGLDPAGVAVRTHLETLDGVEVSYVDQPETPLTVALLPGDGERMLFRDTKGAAAAVLAPELVLQGCNAVIPTNIEANFPVLDAACARGLPVFADVQALASLDDPHNAPFCDAAEMLAMSDAAIPCAPSDWVREVGRRFGTPTIVLGMAARGALVATGGGRVVTHVPAAAVGTVASTVGAGDALWACFADGQLRGMEPVPALRRAVVFAGAKIGHVGGSRGFLSAEELAQACAR